jgi:hypothetical protein
LPTDELLDWTGGIKADFDEVEPGSRHRQHSCVIARLDRATQ